MQQLNPTRSNLLALRNQIELARHGCHVLKEKRNALMRELMKIVPEALRESDALETAISCAYQNLIRMLSLDGLDSATSVALASQGEIFLRMEVAKVMGLQIPKMQTAPALRSPLSRGYSIFGLSTRIHQVAADFEKVLQRIQELASTDIQVRRLGLEVRKTTRRVNGLEQIVLPGLARQRKRIQMVLNEREREEIFRRRRIKQSLERGKS